MFILFKEKIVITMISYIKTRDILSYLSKLLVTTPISYINTYVIISFKNILGNIIKQNVNTQRGYISA